MTNKIKVMIVDDSAVVRQVNRETLEREPDIEVIGVASDTLYALDKMTVQWPDVLVIDIAQVLGQLQRMMDQVIAAVRSFAG